MEVVLSGATARRTSGIRRFAVPLLGLSTSLLVVGMLWRAQGLVASRPDPYWFSAMAESLLRGDGLAAYGSMLHRRMPGYPFFIAGLYAVFGVRVVVVQLAQCLLFAGTCWLVQDSARRIYTERVGYIAGVLCAVHPSLLRYVPDLHLETLLTFCLTLSVWLGIRLYEAPSTKRAIPLGIAWGLACLIKAVVLLYPPVFALFFWLSRRRASTGQAQKLWGLGQLAPVAVACVAMALTISPWTIRNYVVTGHIVPTTTGVGDAILRSFIFSRTEFITLRQPPYTDAENESNTLFKALCAAQGAVWEADDLQSEKILAAEAKRRVAADPLAFVKKTFIGIFTFWYQMTSLANSLAAGAMAALAWLFAALGLRRSYREAKPAWLVLTPIVYLNLLLAVLLSLGRYSVPVLPCLVVLAAAGLDTLLPRRSAPETSGTA
jgi:4-amino-4-deoxy-L-arabinose transferase-like glycosyltransferase